MSLIKMVSGLGKFHTNEADPTKPNKVLKEYLAIGWTEIRSLVDNPQNIDKAQAQWFIPSTLPSRIHKKQELDGIFYALWIDLDDQATPNLSEVENPVISLIGACNYEIYNSKGATAERQKARILIPLKSGVVGADWRLFQKICNEKLDALGLIADRATEGCGQPCYLPNRGDLYHSRSRRDQDNFNPYEAWANELQFKKDEAIQRAATLKDKQEKAVESRATLKLDGSKSDQFTQLLDLFNKAFTPQAIMTAKGYEQEGDTFRHPKSESGSYSATVKLDSKGVLRVNSLSPADPLYSTQGAHDAFSVYTVLEHGGDRNAAMIEAGSRLLMIDSIPFNKAYKLKDVEPFSLDKFSLKGHSKEMKKKMLDDSFVLDRLAILGQGTVIYAKPNTGKTLLVIHMLIKSIEAKRIDGERVFYINADDDYKGLVYKTTLAEKYNFHMLAPEHNGFKSDELVGHMQQLINNDTARGVVIILDTLKKFVDLMNKSKGREFMQKAREFISSGGTIIMLAHTNKNRDADGKAVFGGTSDVADDCDCVYILDEASRDDRVKQVFFENVKSRGDVANELAFSYSIEEGKSYKYKLDSISEASKADTTAAKAEVSYLLMRERDQLTIDAITESIQEGINLKTDLINSASERSGIGRQPLLKVLAKYEGNGGKFLWREVKGVKHKKEYYLNVPAIETTPEDYERYKNGE